MKNPLIPLMLMLLLALCGCAGTRYAEVGGERFAMISEKEEQELAEQARLALSRIAFQLSPAEKRAINSQQPELRFIYSGDRFGRAVVRWVFPDREVGVNFEGEFMTRHMTSMIYTKGKEPEVVDFRHPSAPQKEKIKRVPRNNNPKRRKN